MLVLSVIITLFAPLAVQGNAYVSSTCIGKSTNGDDDDGIVTFVRCPDEADRTPKSLGELKENLNSKEEERAFCCGHAKTRYCCDIDSKLSEDPFFAPLHMGLASNNNENENYSEEIQDVIFEVSVMGGYRRPLGWLGFLFGLCTIFVVIYFFGAVFFAALDCIFFVLCGLCMKSSNRTNNNNSARVTDGIKTANSNSSSNSNKRITSTSDLYQNATPPPSYNAISSSP